MIARNGGRAAPLPAPGPDERIVISVLPDRRRPGDTEPP
jgi:hypothetical protein